MMMMTVINKIIYMYSSQCQPEAESEALVTCVKLCHKLCEPLWAEGLLERVGFKKTTESVMMNKRECQRGASSRLREQWRFSFFSTRQLADVSGRKWRVVCGRLDYIERCWWIDLN